jgi:hypothetical protein
MMAMLHTYFRIGITLCLAFAGTALVVSQSGQAQTSGRVFELRTYTCAEGRLPALEKRFREHTIKIFDKHGMKSIGYWVPRDPPRSQNTLIYILAHPSREAADKNWAAFRADPEWQRVQKASEADGKIVVKVESVFMDPTDFSPMK